ncbi:hypothetical protein ACFLQ0_04465, partial [Nitrospinota bacterium]
AEKIIFIGYSFPTTDIASGFLFRESIRYEYKENIEIVNLCGDEEEKENLKNSYQSVLPLIGGNQFYFDGAVPWIGDYLSGQPAPNPE